MGAMSRTKGKVGEREVAALLRDLAGWDVQRRVRQHDGDSDLVGVPGWCVEVKRVAAAPRASLKNWWAQAVEQSQKHGGLPVLFYRANRGEWRAVWPLSCHLTHQSNAMWTDYEWTVEADIQAWVSVAREIKGEMYSVRGTDKDIGDAEEQPRPIKTEGVFELRV